MKSARFSILEYYSPFDWVPVLFSSISLDLLDLRFPYRRQWKIILSKEVNELNLFITYPVHYLTVSVFYKDLVLRLISLNTSASCLLIHLLHFLRLKMISCSFSQFPVRRTLRFPLKICVISTTFPLRLAVSLKHLKYLCTVSFFLAGPPQMNVRQ